ncbi:SVM family protein [Candidatus Phytoplasma asteris]|uniref:SVM family protein n=1 Tax=Candidatus Phytoplasma asteris TaxID=85620 RepID=A0ABZ2YFV0_9MOLU
MFKFKNNLLLLNIFLFILLGLFLITNNHQVMATPYNVPLKTIYQIQNNHIKENKNKLNSTK